MTRSSPSTAINAAPLKLLAFDADDLAIVSAHAQDAVFTIADIGYQPKDRRFVALMNRLDHTTVVSDAATIRRRSALRIERVTRAEVQGIDLKSKNTVVALLALKFRQTEAPAGTITLMFAGAAAIRLHVECVEASLVDLGPAWTTTNVPHHSLDNADAPDKPTR